MVGSTASETLREQVRERYAAAARTVTSGQGQATCSGDGETCCAGGIETLRVDQEVQEERILAHLVDVPDPETESQGQDRQERCNPQGPFG